MVKLPHISRVNERCVEYFDEEYGKAFLAAFEDVYADHIQVDVSTPWIQEMRTVCIDGIKLETAENYKALLERLGYYEDPSDND